MHWACLEASALGSLIAAYPAWKREEETVLPTKSYQILNRFNLNGRFRYAVYVAPEYLLEIATDDTLSHVDRIPA